MERKRLLIVIFLVFFTVYPLCVVQKGVFTKMSKLYNSYKASQNMLHVLAVGDSLTTGSGSLPEFKTPYTKKLKDLFDVEGIPVAVYNFGKIGEKTPQMANRLQRLLPDFNAGNSLVLILGGTNDYLNFVDRYNLTDADEGLSENIISMHKICQKLNFRTVLMSVPFVNFQQYLWSRRKRLRRALTHVADFNKMDQLRLRVNRNIQLYAESHRGDVLFIDLAMLVDAHKNDESFWDKDGLHFSKHGYDMMGEYIFKHIKYFVKLELLG